MKKIITKLDICKMSKNEYNMLLSCLENENLHLLGISYKKFYRIYENIANNNIAIE